ncbi:MAG: TMEM43 family protein [Kiritimatiellia bacterium]
MSADTFTEVTKQSWFSRIGGAIKGILAGLLLIIASFPLLFWNEGRAVKRYKTLKEGEGLVVSVSADAVDQNNSGKLVHLTGMAKTDETLADPVFGVSRNAIKLRRTVEMYQWEEDSESQTKKKMGGGEETVTTYTYKKVWSDSPIDSSSFKQAVGHDNPKVMAYQTLELVAQNVLLGAFTLSPSLLAKINVYVTVLPEEGVGLADSPAIKRQPGGFYIGPDPAVPQIGDLRVTFSAVDPLEISLVSGQQGSTFEPYQTKAGGTINLLQAGPFSAAEMFATAQRNNKLLTWALRAGGFLLMLIGFNLVFKLLSVLADVIPIFGTIVGAGTGIIAFMISLCLSSATIAVAWIFYRPLLGIALLAVTIGSALLIRKKVAAAKPA